MSEYCRLATPGGIEWLKVLKEIDARLDRLLAEKTWNDLWVGRDKKSRSVIDDGCMDVASYNNANKKNLVGIEGA